MEAVNVSEAEGRFSELIGRVEAGESIDLTRYGHTVARVTPARAPRRAVDAALLAAARDGSPPQPISAGELSALCAIPTAINVLLRHVIADRCAYGGAAHRRRRRLVDSASGRRTGCKCVGRN